MNLLAFDTSTETLSIALGVVSGDAARTWKHEGEGGAKASAQLLPAILGLLEQAGLRPGQLDVIVFGRGPGSFTGLRTACSVAQGLAFGAGLPVLPVDTLLAVAEEARHSGGAKRVVAVLDARMHQVYAASHEHDGSRWHTRSAAQLMAPADVQVPAGWVLAGNAFDAHASALPQGSSRVPALPSASALLRLAPQLLAAGAAVPPEQAFPLYLRDKVARTIDERAADRAALCP
jgi:tRNA threonylcarbamoyladenosine biosynthesis protein TsaB